jgi:hypothetical protein
VQNTCPHDELTETGCAMVSQHLLEWLLRIRITSREITNSEQLKCSSRRASVESASFSLNVARIRCSIDFSNSASSNSSGEDVEHVDAFESWRDLPFLFADDPVRVISGRSASSTNTARRGTRHLAETLTGTLDRAGIK